MFFATVHNGDVDAETTPPCTGARCTGWLWYGVDEGCRQRKTVAGGGRGSAAGRPHQYLYPVLPRSYTVLMDIKIIELEADKVRISFVGENHTYLNALTNEILTDPAVDVASYDFRYHFVDPTLLVTTRGGADPVAAIIRGAQAIAADCSDLIAQIEKQ